MRGLVAIALVAACGGGGSTPPPAEPRPVTTTPTAPTRAEDPRLVHLRTMTESLALLAADIERITADAAPSPARCRELDGALRGWADAHYSAYEVADAEGTFLGLTEADAANPELVELARTLARTSSQLVELVDEDCLYGSGAYGEALFEYLVAYQGLAHWVREGDPAVWDYETLIAES